MLSADDFLVVAFIRPAGILRAGLAADRTPVCSQRSGGSVLLNFSNGSFFLRFLLVLQFAAAFLFFLDAVVVSLDALYLAIKVFHLPFEAFASLAQRLQLLFQTFFAHPLAPMLCVGFPFE